MALCRMCYYLSRACNRSSDEPDSSGFPPQAVFGPAFTLG